MIRHILFVSAFLFTLHFAFAQYTPQNKYFVYLQTEPAQPFYIRIDGKKIDANSSGYLILPQLKNNTYKLAVGFPENKYPEQNFNFVIDSKDKGYLIKKIDNEWALFDLQTMAVQKPIAANSETAIAANKPQTDKTEKATVPAENVSDFTKVLSKAANDPGLLEKPKPEPVEEKTKPEPQQPIAITEEVKEVQPENNAVLKEESKAAETINTNKTASKELESPVVKLSEIETTKGTTIIYSDNTGGIQENVKITIPRTKQVVEQKPSKPPVVMGQKQIESGNDWQGSAGNTYENKKNEKSIVKEVATTVVTNCTKTASEDDFLDLRRVMAQQSNDDEMLEKAVAAFKKKCYTTDQVKYLGTMFISNAGKYNLFEAAIKHVSDPQNFIGLQSQLKDQYYINKFKSLISQ